jgi:hypothetical protein
VTGAAAAACYLPLADPQAAQRRLVWLALAGWAAQGASGAGFGAISYASYGHFPDIHGIAVAALVVKIVCAAAGFSLAAVYLVRAPGWSAARRHHACCILFAFALTALTAAAFLRWFS